MRHEITGIPVQDAGTGGMAGATGVRRYPVPYMLPGHPQEETCTICRDAGIREVVRA